MRCPTCGAERKLHSPDLWRAHQHDHKSYMKQRKQRERDVKKRKLMTSFLPKER